VTAAATTRPYPLDNHHDISAAHHQGLADLLDPFTVSRLAGLGDWIGGRCLEVGAGAGSIAHWLADQVGPTGEVVATDLKPDLIPPHPRLRTVAYDLTTDGPLAVLGGPFDLIHARLTLAHLPNRRIILHRLADLLAPGGTLLIEDWSANWGAEVDQVVIAAPTGPDAELYLRYHNTAGQVFAAAGTDPGWAWRTSPAMLQEDLVGVETMIHGSFWPGGGPGLKVVAAAARQLRPKLLAAGMTGDQLDRLDRLMVDPQLVVHPHLLYSTSGRRPD
jgi:SAM-dependent methyltransferase